MLSFSESRFVGKKLFVLFAALVLTPNNYGQTEIKKLSLNEAVEIGLKNNPEVKGAKGNISVSKGRYWSGIALPQPEVGVSYEYAPVNSSLSNYSERTFEVSQSFEFPSSYFLKGSKLNKEEQMSSSHQTCLPCRQAADRLFLWSLRIEKPAIIISGIDTIVLDNNDAKKTRRS